MLHTFWEKLAKNGKKIENDGKLYLNIEKSLNFFSISKANWYYSGINICVPTRAISPACYLCRNEYCVWNNVNIQVNIYQEWQNSACSRHCVTIILQSSTPGWRKCLNIFKWFLVFFHLKWFLVLIWSN